MRFSYGLPRDWLIGISVVGTDGTETKAGGRVVKNVTGYDLNKLYSGSLGTLGVIVEASFKLAPLPDTWAGVAIILSHQCRMQWPPVVPLSHRYMPHRVLQVISANVADRLGCGVPGTGFSGRGPGLYDGASQGSGATSRGRRPDCCLRRGLPE